MDPRLHVAACNGDVGALQELLQEDSLALSKATLAISSSDSPLHIAAMLGHTDFAKLVMSRNPELSRELNQQGYSPIHVASIKGHSQIVTELLNFDKGLCFLRDCEGRTPLHCAAIKGRVEVIPHLMGCCPESAMKFTDKGETLLHLVVSNSQKEAMVLLISSLRELNMLHKLIDSRDEDGNTALQLAIARNHKQMTKMLSKETENHEDEITAQQAVLIDMDRNNQNQMIKTVTNDQNHKITAGASQGSDGDRDFPWKDKLASMHNAIIVVCSLLATCCFEAMISPPGGVWQNRPSRHVIHEENIKNISAFSAFFLDKNITLKDLLAPNKAMSMALQPNNFILFLLADVTCFTASLATIYLVTLTVCFPKKGAFVFAAGVMLQIVFFSASFLFSIIIQLTSNTSRFVFLIWLLIICIPLAIILATYFMKQCWPPISSRLASCYSRLRVHISNRCEKMISKVFLTQHVSLNE